MRNSTKTMKAKKGFLDDTKEIIILLAVVLVIRTFGFGLYHVPTGSMETRMLVGERFFGDKLTVFFTKINHGDIVAFNDPMFKYSENNIVRIFQEYFWGPDNWTKRVIGIPGDEIKGVVEDGKPVVYRNGQKLDEQYVNKYPLIHVWSVGFDQLQKMAQRDPNLNLGKYIHPKSYDPNLPFDSSQPFYRINKDRIFMDPSTGQPLVYQSNTLTQKYGQKVERGDEYWNNGDEFYVKLKNDEYWFMGDNRLGSSDARVFGPVKGKYIRARILFRIWSVDTDEAWWIWDLIKNPVDFFKRVRWSRVFQVVR